MLREARHILIAGLFLLVLTGCAGQQVKYVKVRENPDMHQRVERILTESRSVVSPYSIYRFQFAIVEDKTPNAWVNTQKGLFVVTTGLLRMCDDNELALVFLHENAHIKYNHAAKNSLLSDATSAAFTIGGFFLPGVGYGNLIVNPLVTKGYSRSQELEADKDVIDQCHLLRLTPDHYVSALEKMKQYATSKGDSSDSTGLFDSHPNLQYRIDTINTITGKTRQNR
ncbi:MAG: M48 family metalloprotease [Syntrophorhabdaceae bacterium]|nr:M48 family metalloprotease [Syntrophorhabdaceae bacterium]